MRLIAIKYFNRLTALILILYTYTCSGKKHTHCFNTPLCSLQTHIYTHPDKHTCTRITTYTHTHPYTHTRCLLHTHTHTHTCKHANTFDITHIKTHSAEIK